MNGKIYPVGNLRFSFEVRTGTVLIFYEGITRQMRDRAFNEFCSIIIGVRLNSRLAK